MVVVAGAVEEGGRERIDCVEATVSAPRLAWADRCRLRAWGWRAVRAGGERGDVRNGLGMAHGHGAPWWGQRRWATAVLIGTNLTACSRKTLLASMCCPLCA